MKNVLIIDGWWASGKSTLRQMLDGHPNVLVSPLQESIPSIKLRAKLYKYWQTNCDSEALRYDLATATDYYRLERYAHNKTLSINPSKTSLSKNLFDLDFSQLDQKFFSHLYRHEAWTDQVLTQAYFNALSETWEQYPTNTEELSWFVTMDNNYAQAPEYYLKHRPEVNLVYFLRPAEGIIATRAGRRAVENDFRTAAWEKLTVKQLLRKGETWKIQRMQEKMKKLQKKYPDRIMLCDFEDSIVNYQKTALRISEFMGISHHPTLEKATFCGHEMISDSGESFLGRVNDRTKEILGDQYSLVMDYVNSTNLLSLAMRNPLEAVNYIYSSLKRKLRRLSKIKNL